MTRGRGRPKKPNSATTQVRVTQETKAAVVRLKARLIEAGYPCSSEGDAVTFAVSAALLDMDGTPSFERAIINTIKEGKPSPDLPKR